MKKWLFAVSLVLLIVMTVVLLKEGPTATAKVSDSEELAKIETTYEPLTGTVSLYYNDEEVPMDAATNVFYLPVSMEAPVWNTGSFTGYVIKEEGADPVPLTLCFEEDHLRSDKKTAIAEGKKFRFLAVSKKSYAECFVVFTGLPMLTFESTEFTDPTGQPLYYCRLLEASEKKNRVSSFYTTAALRGNTSLTYEKKSLRLRLKKFDKDGNVVKDNKNLLGLRSDDDWILNALYADNTRVRDKLCIDLWKEVGAYDTPYAECYGTDATYVEVMINGGYQGLYSLMVPIDKKQLGLTAVSVQLSQGGEAAELTERLYKKKFTAAWNAADFEGEIPDPNAPDYRGGWYLKGDTVLQTEEEWAPLHEVARLLEADDATFAQNIGAVTDVKNAVDNWLFYQAIGGFDNINKNYYFVTRRENGALKGYFIPWDMNLSFGAVYAENEFFSEESEAAKTEYAAWLPGDRMIALNVLRAEPLAKATWEKWRAGAFSDEALTAQIKELEHTVKDSGAFAREQEKWPDGNADADFSFLYEYAAARMQYMDELMK